MKDLIRKYALQNAIRYNGVANPGNIIGKVIGEKPELKSDMKGLMNEIQAIVKEVNSLSMDEQRQELERGAPELLEKKQTKKEPHLPNLGDVHSIVTRFAPSPSGPLHIGHAYVLCLNQLLCKKYGGKLYLRIEDTNPENIYPGAYEMIPKDASWLLGGEVAGVVVQSDRLGHYYDYAQKLIGMGHAYICTCDADAFRVLGSKKQACPCRSLPSSEHQKRYGMMFGSFKPGEAVMRIKTDIEHPNPAMRDWPAMRINDHVHPRQNTKHRVWPLMNFSVAVDDHLMGITHTIRAKDHMDNEKRQQYVYDYFGWKMPHNLYVGRINFSDMQISTSETRQMIDQGKYSGWDDIQLPFLLALKKRGYHPSAFMKYAQDVGVTQNDKVVSKQEFFTAINHFDSEWLEPHALRFFFVAHPVEITINGAPTQEVTLSLHPDHKKGGRIFKTGESFYVSKLDYDTFAVGKLYRLMDCLTFVKTKDGFTFEKKEYEKEKQVKLIHWLAKENDLLQARVRMEDGSFVDGLGEKTLSLLSEGDVCQFERFGFVRLVDKKTMEFWWLHR